MSESLLRALIKEVVDQYNDLDNEKHLQYVAALSGHIERDYYDSLMLRADDIESGRNDAGCPEHMRAEVAAYLRQAAQEWKLDEFSSAGAVAGYTLPLGTALKRKTR